MPIRHWLMVFLLVVAGCERQPSAVALPTMWSVVAVDPFRGIAFGLPSDATQTTCDRDECVWDGGNKTRYRSDFAPSEPLNEATLDRFFDGRGRITESPPGSGHWHVEQNCGHSWHFLGVNGRVVRLHCWQDGLDQVGRGSCTSAYPQVAAACATMRAATTHAVLP